MRSRRYAIAAIKYLPVVSAAFMLNHVIWAIFFGIELNIAENFVAMEFYPAIVFLIVSHAFGFCWLHKAFVIYDLLVCLALDYHREIGFEPTPLLVVMVVFFVLGIVLFALLIIKHRVYSRCCKLCEIDEVE